jgi:GalNAc-alpha-(1->4)-GalNAc-alpha-(1->3)-diNAcBac-PP-undecaprenol alpha-1,4-N-acetyl-D-galactosaminyltransferase
MSGAPGRPRAGDPSPGGTGRLTLVIASLAGGGAERVMARLAGRWVEQWDSVTLITLYPESHDYVSLDPRVERRVVGHTTGRAGMLARGGAALRRLLRLRHELVATRPDVVVSFMNSTNVMTLLAAAGTSIPVVVSERTDPRQHPVGAVADWVRRRAYQRAALVVVQTESVSQWAGEIVPSSRVRCIPNPVPEPSTRDLPAERTRTVVGVGRLSPEKGFDLLIHAFAAAGRGREWRLEIVGRGSEMERLQGLATELGVRDRVSFSGWVDDPGPRLATAGLFVLPSRYEGYPNALLEAMASGAPVVAADCPSGPREIIRDGIDGVLVAPGSAEALAEAMGRLMDDAGERARLGARALEVATRFGAAHVVSLWNQALHQVARREVAEDV